jgi:cysteine synthase
MLADFTTLQKPASIKQNEKIEEQKNEQFLLSMNALNLQMHYTAPEVWAAAAKNTKYFYLSTTNQTQSYLNSNF